MAQTLEETMTPDPRTCPADASLTEVARVMRDEDIGDVIVLDGDAVSGIVTDRDIVVRAVAVGMDPDVTPVREVCSGDPVTLPADTDAEHAAEVMRESGVRRLPVVHDDRLVGVVSLGDLAVERDPESALADISARPGNR